MGRGVDYGLPQPEHQAGVSSYVDVAVEAFMQHAFRVNGRTRGYAGIDRGSSRQVRTWQVEIHAVVTSSEL